MSLQEADTVPPRGGNLRPIVERAARFALNENALALLVLLVIVCGILSRNFLSPQNLANLADQMPIFAILAAGQLVVILSGGIDLSVGSVLALCAFFAAALSHQGLLAALAVPVLVGAAVGLLNGLGAAYTRVPPFIITLAMLSIARGFALQSAAWYNGGSVTGSGAAPVSASRDFGFPLVSSGSIFGLPIAALIAIAVFAAIAYVLRYEPFGRHVYAVGGNEAAARLSGIKVWAVLLFVYGISGLLAGLGGVMQAARLYAANGLQLGQSYELDAIAAVILGGTSFVGGIGSIWGTLIGALIIAVLTNGLILLGVTDVWQYIAKGAVIIGAVALDRYRLRGSART